MAHATERIGIGTCIVNPYTIHPAELRWPPPPSTSYLAAGFTLASPAAPTISWVGSGSRAGQPVTAVAETTRALRHLFAGGRGLPAEASRVLRDWTTEAYLRFPSRPIPIYIGAMSPRMLRLIGAGGRRRAAAPLPAGALRDGQPVHPGRRSPGRALG